MKSLRSLSLTLRFILPLAIALILMAYAAVPLVDKLTLQWFVRDLDIRSHLIANSLQEPLMDFLERGERAKINALFGNVIKDERLFAIGYCNGGGKLLYHTPTFPKSIPCLSADPAKEKPPSIHPLPQGPVHVSYNAVDNPDDREGVRVGSLVILHDMSYIERRSAATRKYIIIFFTVLGVIISLITVFVAHLSWRGWMAGVRAMLRGEGILKPFSVETAPAELKPLAGDLRNLFRTLDAERRFTEDISIVWNPDSLRRLLHKQLAGERILVVSNREPYIHVKTGERIEVSRPASGLVTAVEPVMRACSGTWIAHGGGSADRETVDAHDRVGIPPEHPEYTLRRIWLTKEEEDGYYYGFANEGLWPLCHIAHVRPIFRSSDWRQYKAINQRFADAVAAEADSENPVVLAQDYHFALLPEMIRKALPKATIITFWHIPWPNPESFGICPWREEILEGMLGSTIMGFHTPFHCRNFLETVDRYLEVRIEPESSTISRQGKLTLVENYPISIQWPPPWQETQPSVQDCRREVLQSTGLPKDGLIGLGVDRQDYTKGILERFRAVENLLETHPEMIGRFTFIQIAAPSRSTLEDYQMFAAQVRSLADRINGRFARGAYRPVCLRAEHHEPEIVNRFYRAADVCMVTSLHDGMNLVAKEFVASRDDEQGVLVLSQFTGAAHELHESLIVNPYHIEQTAEALYQALTMPDFEQRERMRSMRALVRDFNVYRWAGRMLLDAARIRQRERLALRIGGAG
ncbi:MAG: Trehalose-phosphate synthase [Syntrophaceae bacterium PtaB.Bin095]|nr:MAG: Trehalose-phosphate synthase [Syntrophaceae bacterium PtaB.Bin095]